MANFANIAKVPELRARLLFTLGLLAVYRTGVFITTPGVDRSAMQEYLGQIGGLFSLVNMFTGGAMEQVSIFALGIMPYVSASIIISLLKVVIPAIDELYKEGEQGMRTINQWTRYGTLGLAVIQGIGMALFLQGIDAGGRPVVTSESWAFVPMTVLSLTAGTIFIMWLGEQINERGVGNGISLIIFAGIVAGIPAALRSTVQLATGGGDVAQVKPIQMVIFLVVMVVTVGVVIFIERGQRQIPIQYPKRVEGRKVLGGGTTHLPLRVNTSGVIPPIFASSLLMFPATLVNFLGQDNVIINHIQQLFAPGSISFNVAYVVLIVFFTFFYTAVQFNPMDVAENLKKNGGYIPGIRPGRSTADYLDTVLSRLTVLGAIYLAAVCVLPTIVSNTMGMPFYFGGTSILIVVGVALDTMAQIEGHLITRHYEGFTGRGGPRIRGRRG